MDEDDEIEAIAIENGHRRMAALRFAIEATHDLTDDPAEVVRWAEHFDQFLAGATSFGAVSAQMQ